MNAFVDYLNSINNVSGNSAGSLAESQVKSPYFEKVEVNRKISKIIADTVKNKKYQAFILTGHAGDGKTSILVQVLRNLGYISTGEGLQQERSYSDFYYVKDMSEISETTQLEALQKTLESPVKGKTSLLISNTGPLINTFMRFVESEKRNHNINFSQEDKINLQSQLLKQLDSNNDTELEIEGFHFVLVNIARVDNVSFAKQILEKIISEDLWVDCKNCKTEANCPIKKNVDLVKSHFDRVSKFLSSFYRYLYENDQRMTIRQMVGQISFAITGDLSCNYVNSNFIKYSFFNYNFANLFFGYKGINVAANSEQIKGISQIQKLNLDAISLDIDYKLFVNNDYSFFPYDIQIILQDIAKTNEKFYQISEEDINSNNDNANASRIRRSFRRFYLVFGNNDGNDDEIFNQIFGRSFTDYEKLIYQKQSKAMLNRIQALLFDALYIRNTGFLPNGSDDLPLTLRREDNVFQNVMLILGSVPKKDLCIEQKPVLSKFEDLENKQTLCLSVKGDEFILTLPMLNYFEQLVQGSVASNNNPALSHGIAKLDTLLLDKFGDEMPKTKEDCELKVLINTDTGQVKRKYYFEGDYLKIE